MCRIFFILLTAGCLAATAPQVSAQTLASGSPDVISQEQMAETLEAMPLLEAHQYLMWARSEVLEHDYPGAVAALLTVAQSLAAFQMQEPGPHGKDAAFTRERIVEYTSVLPGDPTDAVSRIENWMDRISHWDGGK